jgi:hypothetical protein
MRDGSGALAEVGGERYEGDWKFDQPHGVGLQSMTGAVFALSLLCRCVLTAVQVARHTRAVLSTVGGTAPVASCGRRVRSKARRCS